MITIIYEHNISEYQESSLLDEFERIKIFAYVNKNQEIISLIYKLIEKLPFPYILEEFIFTKRKYNILIRHDALLRAIELEYHHILEKVLLKSTSVELIKTAIFNIDDDFHLKQFITCSNHKLPDYKFRDVQLLALNNIKDHKIFREAFNKIYTDDLLVDIYRKIRHKSRYRTFSSLQKRLFPILFSLLPEAEMLSELNREKKYPLQIRNSMLKEYEKL
ncbi:MAG: hypothetical protein ACW99Q_04695 [Candidatus Kariarchaeaceae archaeon]